MRIWRRNFGCRSLEKSWVFLSTYEGRAAPVVGGVIPGAQGTFCLDIPIFGTFLGVMICTAFNAARNVVTIILRVAI